jgi:hypothetical protein
MQKQRNQEQAIKNRNKTQRNRENSISGSVKRHIIPEHLPGIEMAERNLRPLNEALTKAEKDLRNAPPGSSIEEIARLEQSRNNARRSRQAAKARLNILKSNANNAVRNEKRRVGTVRNNRKAKRNANNAANAKAKNEMLPLPNFNTHPPTATPIRDEAAAAGVNPANLPARKAEQNRAAAPGANNANMAARGLFD